jgi:cyclase
MLRARITPYLLLRGRGLVKTQQFGNAKYVGDPINAVKIFNEKEVDELCLLDIEASVNNRAPDLELLRDIASESRMPLCYGGGIRDAETAAKIIALGYEKISISAAAVERPPLIAELAARIGSQSTVVTLDVRREGLMGNHVLYTHNGTRKHPVNPLVFAAEAQALGAGEIVINSIERDGMMQGYDLKFARRMREAVTLPLSFIGGAGSLTDMAALIDTVGAVGAGAGSMFVFHGRYRAVLINYARPERS